MRPRRRRGPPAARPASPGRAIAPEPGRIDVFDPRAMVAWARRFGVSVDRLWDAVISVGDDPGLVARHLG